MKRDSLDNWKKFGKTDPYFGVLSDEKYKTENITEDGLNEFFETGEAYVKETAERIEQAFSISLEQASILDFGCGVGRLAIPFSRVTRKEVVGLDISPEIIEKAKEHALTFERENVRFQVYDGKNLPELPSFDFVNSYIVLQHIEVDRGLALLQQLLDKVKIGGIAHIQVTHSHELPTRSYLNFYLRTKVPAYNFLYSSVKNREFTFEPVMQMNLYNTDLLKSLFAKYSSDVKEVKTNHGGILGSFYMIRREY
ncbi:class I SAM-dependent methyltransferase [Belliella aquatica]|uniref:SAM-dependent methyltransferase n=1 Tax=Belliella aquatica TaxID=1323734 RepID=A0ABQ1LMZ1_9BACT|nr:class I SAM-dependent methyltransferase [Belliella aquatica]MCH7404191.1 class I SAM-dependent methyltransferase [Belliella aquatica]GGC26023.1 SAM-dependent methyltransferase [Belliella aquatica]